MEGLVNYSSEDDQDDYPYIKVAVRERGSGSAANSARTATEASQTLKRSYEHAKSGCSESEAYRKGRDAGYERFKSASGNYYEDKYKIDRRTEKSREHREKRDNRESKMNREARDGDGDYDSNQKHDNKKIDDYKRHREQKRDYTRDGNDYNRDDKRYTRHDERKTSHTANNKDRFSTLKSRYDDRKQYDDRFNDERRATHEERRSGGSYIDDRRKDRRYYNKDNKDDEQKTDRRSDDRRSQRSYNEDRSNTYRPRRSISPLPSHKSYNKNSERKEDGNIRRERKRHSRSRSRSRSHSPDTYNAPNLSSINSSHHRVVSGEPVLQGKHIEGDSQISEKKNLPTARNFEALLNLPLSENAPKNLNAVTVPVTSTAVVSNTATATVQLPSYYNPNVINPNKYVEQMQKRKLIWGAKKSEDTASKWGHAQFSQDQDGKVASKFMRLMGIKSGASSSNEPSISTNESEKKSPPSTTPPNNIDVKSREAMFSSMEQQYEVARQVTHTMRGVGLGFGSQSRPY